MAPHDLATKTEALVADLRGLGSVAVAFSGGADSGLLAKLATDTLGPEHSVVVTAVSPSLPDDELADCAALAEEWELNWLTVETSEMENAAYRVNDADRCYWCKDALMAEMSPIAAAQQATVVLGVNVDDLADHRPGQRAAKEQGARFPFVDAGFTKADVRALSAQMGLRTADKPAAACLASRLPYGTEVRLETLSQVEKAERALRRLGISSLRVRHYDQIARIEVPLDSLEKVLASRERVVAAVKAAGYEYVTLDLEGFRSGNLNAQLEK